MTRHAHRFRVPSPPWRFTAGCFPGCRAPRGLGRKTVRLRPRRGDGRGLGRAWALAALLVAAGCSTNILHGIDERAANDATAALERAGIGAEKVADEGASGGSAGYTVRVAHGDGTRALDLLRALG